jgi:hypothetical protein
VATSPAPALWSRGTLATPNVVTTNRPEVVALIEEAASNLTAGYKTELPAACLWNRMQESGGYRVCWYGVVSRVFRTFGLAERLPSLAYAVIAPLICWSFSSSMFR